ncbi:probable protein phosphatase 2C 26 isoform X2 [Helianthus annuus]|uniref:probable protein phosphatase 2C 26 isoform X2 n=1 Tax=Helianthus annuus TaxID=4232 RepID=UPI000B8F027F|nr:probable protein phosphatase 2C 26 isoform X2 [Helianthus annuus]
MSCQFLSSSGTAIKLPRKKVMSMNVIGCSTSPIPNPVLRPELSIRVGTRLIPHPKKADKGGEDAFFVSGYNGGVMAVADGVSGWAEKDVDPAQFSRELMRRASSLVDDEEVNYDPRILVRKAHAATSSTGSATVIVSMLDNNGILKIANVGDCGLRVIRKGQIIFSTFPQEHYFDCPYQLSSETVSQTYLDATVTSIDIVKGDIIVMGSDGLFDNVFDHEIVSTIKEHKDVAETAKVLADLAYKHSVDFYFDSPFSIEARNRPLLSSPSSCLSLFPQPLLVYSRNSGRGVGIGRRRSLYDRYVVDKCQQGLDVPWWKKALGQKLTGGKMDDITVIIGEVSHGGSEMPSSS